MHTALTVWLLRLGVRVIHGRSYQPSPRPFPAELPPIEYAPGAVVRRVQAKGAIALHGQYYQLGRTFQGYSVAVQPTLAPDGVTVQFCHETIAELDLTQPDA